jgi:hypothetical protein
MRLTPGTGRTSLPEAQHGRKESHIRFRGQTGKHLLSLSFTGLTHLRHSCQSQRNS